MFRKLVVGVAAHERLSMIDDAASTIDVFETANVATQILPLNDQIVQTDIAELDPTESPLNKQPIFKDFYAPGVGGITKVSDAEVTLGGFGDIMRYFVSFEFSVEISNSIPVLVALVVDDKIYGTPRLITAGITQPVYFSDVVIVPPNSLYRLSLHANQQLRTRTQRNRYVASISQLPIASTTLPVVFSNNSSSFTIQRVANLTVFPIL